MNLHRVGGEHAATMTTTPTTMPAHTAKDGKGILITEPAMQQLAKLCGEQGTNQVLRVGVRSGGCSGMSYTMDFVPASDTLDDDAVSYTHLTLPTIYSV